MNGRDGFFRRSNRLLYFSFRFCLLNAIDFGSLALSFSVFYFSTVPLQSRKVVVFFHHCMIFSVLIRFDLIFFVRRIHLSAILWFTGDSTTSILNNQNGKKLSERLNEWTNEQTKGIQAFITATTTASSPSIHEFGFRIGYCLKLAAAWNDRIKYSEIIKRCLLSHTNIYV